MTQHDESSGSQESPVHWGELVDLRRRVHDLLYVQKNPEGARRHAADLERILDGIPASNIVILYWDALALLAELRGEIDRAVEYRRREIELTLELHRLVKEGIDEPYVLVDRDLACLGSRQKILRALLRRRGGE